MKKSKKFSTEINYEKEWIHILEALDLEGMTAYWQSENLHFKYDEFARLSIYVDAEKGENGNFYFNDNQNWMIILHTYFGPFQLLPRQSIQLGKVSCAVFLDDVISESVFHVMITITQTAGYKIFDCIYDESEKAFKICSVYEAVGNVNYILDSSTNLKNELIKNTELNISYYIPIGMAIYETTNYFESFIKQSYDGSSLIVEYCNETLPSQEELLERPYLAKFTPGDSLEKWTTKYCDDLQKDDIQYEFIEKQNNMYILETWTKIVSEDDPDYGFTYIFFKISSGVPLTMRILGHRNLAKNGNKQLALNDGKELFKNFNSIKPYSENPNISFYMVCIGTFKNTINAYNVEEKAKSLGLSAYTSFEGGFYRVTIGSYRIKANAQAAQNSAIEKGFTDAFLYTKIIE